MRKGYQFATCPECRRKGVSMKCGLYLSAEDWLTCRYCDWGCFAYGKEDKEERARLDFQPRYRSAC